MTTPVYPPAPQPVPATFDPQPPVPAPITPTQLPQLADQQATAVQIPEGGYASRWTRIPLPQYAVAGVPEPWVEIRNPGMMPQSALDEIGAALTRVETGPDGEPVARDSGVIFDQLLRLIRSWCMWDATSDADVPPLLPPPVDAVTLRRAPSGALGHVFKTFAELQNPQ
ncbi:hypothetical protein P3T35_003173 [Kitasatospora sp. GP30]|uniref:hypothetical protein n=1 Tax=Kitasatospora sp. GP30 TaxID=3035084 RepID=UPI000C709A50|nr:hypothetical protein [Kitasatospora sp. GP30]MDH6141160.1 hypothetical protein [Kitasatospora sp. GP30]